MSGILTIQSLKQINEVYTDDSWVKSLLNFSYGPE